MKAQLQECHAVEVTAVVKHYSGTTALRDVAFWADYGQVSVVMGENGAGKSTLMKILAGIEMPSAGQMYRDGVAVQPRNVREAEHLGIAMVHQELSLLPNLSVSANIFAGHEPTRGFGWIAGSVEAARSQEVLSLLGRPMPPQQESGSLSLGQQQIVELARAIARRSRVLILDEPTSTLSTAEVRVLFRALLQLKRSGVCIIYISHRLGEVLEIGDRFTVLRDGRVVAIAGREAANERWLVEQMTGRTVSPVGAPCSRAPMSTVLSVEGLSYREYLRSLPLRQALCNVSFDMGHGEVVGVYGLLGAGRTELLECLAGARRHSAGVVRVEGKTVRLESVRSALCGGITLVPGDRQRDALVPELTVRENIALDGVEECRVGPILALHKEKRVVEEWASRVHLATKCLDRPVRSLSGGNQQKAILLRCLMKHPKVLLMDEPTRGIDVGAKEEIGALIRELATEGLSVLFTTSETGEILALTDRSMVLCRGRMTLNAPTIEVTEEHLAIAASGDETNPGAVA
jgi:erythritol transport system ATP-binding protein